MEQENLAFTIKELLEGLDGVSPGLKLKVWREGGSLRYKIRSKTVVLGIEREYIAGGNGPVAVRLLIGEEEF